MMMRNLVFLIRRGIIGRMMQFPFMKYVRETLLRTGSNYIFRFEID